MKTIFKTTALFVCLVFPFSTSVNAVDIITSDGSYLTSQRDVSYTLFPTSINFAGYTQINAVEEVATSCDPIALPNSCAILVPGDVVTFTYGPFSNPSGQPPLLTIQGFSNGEATGTAFSHFLPEAGVTDNSFLVTLNGQHIAYGELRSVTQWLDLNPDYPSNTNDPFLDRVVYFEKYTGPVGSPFYEDILAVTGGTGLIVGTFENATDITPQCPINDPNCFLLANFTATKSTINTTDLLDSLIMAVMNLNLSKGIRNSLDVKLNRALQALDDLNQNNDVAAVNALNAFINEVQAQSGNMINSLDASTLISFAQLIIEQIS